MKGKKPATPELAVFRSFLRAEENAVLLYTALSHAEKNPNLSRVYAMLAETEKRHADEWRLRLTQAGMAPGAHRPDMKTRILLFITKRFGPSLVLPSVLSMESTGTASYDEVDGAEQMASEEESHGRVLRAMSGLGGMAGSDVARAEGRHRGAGGNALRAAVLGSNDGLVSNLSLIMGVAGAGLSNHAILVTGFAGLLAGAISMALGEWLSVQSARELFTHQIDVERAEIATNPEDETEELALIYQARGIPEERARALAAEIMSSPEAAIETLAREELGIDPGELGGSSWEAAISSFLMFAVGAIIPVIAFIAWSGVIAVFAAIALSVVGLFVVGALTSLSTSRSLLFSGLRMVFFGVIAAAVTYGVGHLVQGFATH
ncbi:MAG TPA: VIT1/CCC1 transporter family protein [Spirochaetia bacterium]|nr:VIT1/CCC1 transporter family protein [Spirochaetia bacterium]